MTDSWADYPPAALCLNAPMRGSSSFNNMSIIQALEGSDIETLRVLMNAGIDLAIWTNERAETVYHYALKNTDTQVMKFLLENKIAVRFFTELLVKSVAADRKEHFALLLRHATTANKLSVLEFAADRRKVEFIEQILQSDFDLNTASTNRPALFHLLQFPTLLMGRDIDFTVYDWLRRGACHVIAKAHNITSATLIHAIQNGADSDRTDDNGHTPWKICLENQLRESKYVILFLAGATLPPRRDRFGKVDIDVQIYGETLGEFAMRWFARRVVTALRDDTWADDARVRAVVCGTAKAIIAGSGAMICFALQSLGLPALVTCEILQAYFRMWPRIPFHCYWNMVTAIKHFRRPQ